MTTNKTAAPTHIDATRKDAQAVINWLETATKTMGATVDDTSYSAVGILFLSLSAGETRETRSTIELSMDHWAKKIRFTAYPKGGRGTVRNWEYKLSEADYIWFMNQIEARYFQDSLQPTDAA